MASTNSSRVLTIASGKGGTGKTSTVVNLGTALALIGKNVMILDADIAMANMALHLGIEKSPTTLHDVLAETAMIQDAIYELPSGLKVVPCGVSLSGFEQSNPERLGGALEDMTHNIEFLLIDAPAGISKDGVIPLAVSDEVLLVVNPEISSLADALKTKMVTEMVGSRVGGVILNRANIDKTELSKREIGTILASEVIAIIPEDAEVRRSAALKQPVVIRHKDSPAAVAFQRLAARIAGETFTEPEILGRKEGFVGRFVRSIFGG